MGAPASLRYHEATIDPALLAEVNQLSPAERLEFIGAVWDSVPHAEIPVTDIERQMLDARLVDAESNPDDESPLSEVVARLKRRGH